MMRVALFITCFNDALFPRTVRCLVRVLEELGHRVDFPREQTCCGQIHFNTGYRQEARRLLHRFVRVFERAEVVVAPSASCVSMIREHYPAVASEEGGAELESAVRSLAARAYEMSEFLVERLGVEEVGAFFPARVALHSTCHSLRGIDVGDAPGRLLRAVRGAEVVDLPDARECCGFGGTFSVKNPDTSVAMLSDKIEGILRSGAEVVTAVDNSCLAHIAGGLHRMGRLGGSPPGEGPSSSVGFMGGPARGVGEGGRSSSTAGGGVRVLHLAEILASREGRSG